MSKKSSNSTSNSQSTTTTNQNLGDFSAQMDFSQLLGGSTIIYGDYENNNSKFYNSSSSNFETSQRPDMVNTTTNTTAQKDEFTHAASLGLGILGGSGSGGKAQAVRGGTESLGGGAGNNSSPNANYIIIGIIAIVGFISYLILRK